MGQQCFETRGRPEQYMSPADSARVADSQIDEVTADSAFSEAYSVMKQLRPIEEAEFLALVDEMRSTEAYRLFKLQDGS